MASEVYFARLGAKEQEDGLLQKLDALCQRVQLNKLVGEKELVAVKLHFGEEGNTTFLSPVFAGRIVDRLRELRCRPFLTDANTLYRGSRSNAVDHLNTALRHGFVPPVVNAPVVIADGLTGKDYTEVPVAGCKHFTKVKIGSAAVHAHALVAVTHFKGHMVSGFGGSIKNVGMGLGSRSGKQQMHSSIKPVVNEKCVACGTCIRWCPVEAISIKGKRASIDQSKCIGCGECTVTCPSKAIDINWDGEAREMMERMCEYALGALAGKERKSAFFNFVLSVTPDCDCLSWSDAPIAPDIGILASTDIVAVDQASVDLVVKAAGDVFAKRHNVDWSAQLAYGEKIGLGSRKYTLIEI